MFWGRKSPPPIPIAQVVHDPQPAVREATVIATSGHSAGGAQGGGQAQAYEEVPTGHCCSCRTRPDKGAYAFAVTGAQSLYAPPSHQLSVMNGYR
jgi:hypothetical protein